MSAPTKSRLLIAASLLLSLAACASEAPGEDFLDCQGKCDSAGKLKIGTRWVPVGGSIRAETGGSALTVTPSDGVQIQERSRNRWIATFSTPGYYTAQSGADSIPIRVADEGLQIEILSPVPGEFVTAAEGAPIHVRGHISDPLGAAPTSLRIAGSDISVDQSGGFEVDLAAVFGINTIAISASDLAGNDFDVARSFMAAARYSKEASSSFIQLDNDALAFISEVVEPELLTLVNEAAAELTSSGDAVGDADSDKVLVKSIALPGLLGGPGSIDFSIETDQQGLLQARLSTKGQTLVKLRTKGNLINFDAIITAEDLQLSIAMDFSRYQEVGPIVSSAQLSFAAGTDGFSIDIANVPEFLENLFIDEQEIAQQVSNGLKDAIAPEVSKIFTSFAGEVDVDLDSLGLEQALVIGYGINNVRTVAGALQVDLNGRLPILASQGGAGSPQR